MRIVEIGGAETHPLRRTELRTGTPDTEVVFDGDDFPRTFHLGVRDDEHGLIGVSTWLERPHTARPGAPAYQLRGMATAPEARGTGVGSALLDAGLRICRERQAALVWARARVTAVSFYEQRGFEVVGHQYIDAPTALAHIDIVRKL